MVQSNAEETHKDGNSLTEAKSPQQAAKKRGMGELYMILASVLFATGGLVLKFNDWNPLAVNGVRSLFGAMVIGIFMLATRRKVHFSKGIFFGALSYLAMTTLFIAANRMTAAGNVIVLQYSCPLWIVLLNWLLYRKHPSKKEWIALGFIVLGILCFFLQSLSSGDLAGNLLALASGLFYAILFMLNSMKGGDAMSSVLIGQILGFVVFAPFSIGCSWTASNVLSVIWLGTFQVGLAYLFFCLGTSRVSPLRACLINGIEPVLNPTLCALAGFERLSGLSLLGAAIVILSVLFYSLQGIQPKTGTN